MSKGRVLWSWSAPSPIQPWDEKLVQEELLANWEVSGIGDALARGFRAFPLRECVSIGVVQEVALPQGWARKMCRWLKTKPRGIYRVLHSAAAIRHRRIVVGEKRKRYGEAYNYLRKRIPFLDYRQYRRDHLPIGSGYCFDSPFLRGWIIVHALPDIGMHLSPSHIASATDEYE